jgi:hypothetical protein
MEADTTRQSLFELVFDRVFKKLPRYVHLEVVDEAGDRTVCTLRRASTGAIEESNQRTQDD